MSFYEFILWALQPVMENTACGPDTQKDHQQSMGFGNPALPGSEATREAGGLHADTLRNSTTQWSATQIQGEAL